MLPQQYCLRWRYHHSNLQTMFSQLLERQAFCDVTLACEGQTLKAHKIVLSACSTYFDTILSQYEEKDPILIMKDVKFVDIKCLVEFMYKGEINVEHCHLATLLKTAEELRIKGLAEVSWREEESSNDQTMNGVHSVIPPQVSMDNSQEASSAKRKRGRPPIDDYDQTFPSPKITNITGNVAHDESFSGNEISNSDVDVSVWEDEPNNDNNDNDLQYRTDEDYAPDEPAETNASEPKSKSQSGGTTTPNQQQQSQQQQSQQQSSSAVSNSSISSLESQWPDVIKMNDYLNTGRRQQFWEEPFTKRVMDAIKNKDLEMKTAAELLGVSYGTLYGRYRDAYGCLKHPYRVRDFWTEQGPADILAKLQRKEITLFRAAEQLNVTPQTLSNYLLSLHQGTDNADLTMSHSTSYDGYDDLESEDDTDNDHILPDAPVKASASSGQAQRNSSLTAAVLQNHPDITIIKKEKRDEKMNNNSDHSEGVSDDTDA